MAQAAAAMIAFLVCTICDRSFLGTVARKPE
jgi:hypothetical protein